jgi:hypothetical protein
MHHLRYSSETEVELISYLRNSCEIEVELSEIEIPPVTSAVQVLITTHSTGTHS